MASRSHRPVLVVEDDPDIRDATAILLEDEGYRVLQAENGQRALDALSAEPLPCLILLDLMMPVMDGHEFLERMAGLDARRSKLPVVVMTAAHNPVVPRALQVIKKPYSVEVLLDAVSRHCLTAA